MNHLILFDSHVHIYDCFDVNGFLTAAYNNFKYFTQKDFRGQPFTGVLMLTETAKDHWYERFASLADGLVTERFDAWHFKKTLEPCALLASSGKHQLYIIAGRQVVTSENLEVLALFSRNTIEDGRPIDTILDLVREQDGISVIPWGTGKWLGKRGAILNRLIEERSQDFFLGDNSGRPVFWKHPRHFRRAHTKGIRILPGSDPLPFAEEFDRAASFGAAYESKMDADRPALTMKELLNTPDKTLITYGKLESPLRFIKNQLAMQLVKQRRKQVLH